MVTYPPVLIARITKEEDFLKLKEMAHRHDDWSLAYEKTDLKVWSKSGSDSTIRMIKVWTIFSSISSLDLYNTLMDPDYRKEWDTHLLLFYDIGYLNFNNEISYYAVSFPPPLRSRDFVLQTSWLNRSTEYFILNHSVCHKDHPPRPGFIRAVSHFTGYVIQGMPQEDLQGFIPNWIVAKCTEIFAPKIVKQVEKAAAAYNAWKSQNNPTYFPWFNPEQIKASIIPISDCIASEKEREGAFFKSVLESCAYREEVQPETPYKAEVQPETPYKAEVQPEAPYKAEVQPEAPYRASHAASKSEVASIPPVSSALSKNVVPEPKRKWKPSLRILRSSSKKPSKKESIKRDTIQ